MHIRYNTEELKKVVKNLAELLRISIIVFDTSGRRLHKYSDPEDFCSYLQRDNEFKKKCLACDMALIEKCKASGTVQMHRCHSGLCDVAMPIYKDKILAAYVILGRIRRGGSAPEGFGDTEKALFEGLTVFTGEQLRSLEQILPHIMFDTAIRIENDFTAEDIAEYIRENLGADVSVKSLCKKFYVSKNALYKSFSAEYGCTVNGFVNAVRLETAKKLLTSTELSVLKISEEVGITNYPYFCRLFKKEAGISPYQYRKQNRAAQK